MLPSCLNVVRQPEEEHIADELGTEQAQRELDHTGDEEGPQQADGLLALLFDGRNFLTLGRGVEIEAHVTWLGHEEEEDEDGGAGHNDRGDHEAEIPVL